MLTIARIGHESATHLHIGLGLELAFQLLVLGGDRIGGGARALLGAGHQLPQLVRLDLATRALGLEE